MDPIEEQSAKCLLIIADQVTAGAQTNLSRRQNLREDQRLVVAAGMTAPLTETAERG